jgi:hypothetical protein
MRTLTIILKPKILLVLNKNSRLSKTRCVTSKSTLIEESMGPEHNRRVLSKALHPNSFHCCHPQDPSHVSALSGLVALCARLIVRSAFGFVCHRKIFRERAFDQEATKVRLLFI